MLFGIFLSIASQTVPRTRKILLELEIGAVVKLAIVEFYLQ